ncbi:MAG: hypothetical protein ACTH8A_19080, partial [Serratia proteamaculans]
SFACTNEALPSAAVTSKAVINGLKRIVFSSLFSDLRKICPGGRQPTFLYHPTYPMDFKLQPGGQLVHPQALT